MVVFGQNLLYWYKVVVVGLIVVLGENWLCSDNFL